MIALNKMHQRLLCEDNFYYIVKKSTTMQGWLSIQDGMLDNITPVFELQSFIEYDDYQRNRSR